MTVYERIIRGAEAGALAAAGVAVVFLFGDLLALAPLHTPTILANGLFGAPTDPAEAGLLASAVALAGMGFRLVAYTVLHFAAFSLVGILGAFVLKTGGFLASIAGGALFGATVFTAVFYGSRGIIHDAPVVLQGAGVGTVMGVNLVAGVILGAGLHLAGRDDVAQGDAAAATPASGQAEAGA